MKDKHFGASALCLLCLLLAAVPLAAQSEEGYVEIGESRSCTCSLYLPSVETREHQAGDYVVGWIRYDYNDIGAAEYAIDGTKACYSMKFYAANPKARQIQAISATYYDSEDKVIDSNNSYFNQFMWNECIPGSHGEVVWNALMKAAGYR